MELDRRSLLRFTGSAGLLSAVATAGPMIAGAPGAFAAGSPVNSRQFRGMWVASVGNMDWPTATGLSQSQQKKQFADVLSVAQGLHLNAIISQVRPSADTFWPSKLEPWSAYLTGIQGRSPGYDPLAYQIAETHKRGMEFHAWINPFRVSTQGSLSKLASSHPARKHPDWVFSYNGQLYYNPGIPDVRKHVSAVVMDIVSRYDIDAIHFDDYFYPYPVDGKKIDDATAFKKFGKSAGSVHTWRRKNISDFVKSMSQQIHAKKSWVKFGISPFGIWRNRSSDSRGSNTSGNESYSANYADTRAWVKNNWIDYIAPQLYWADGNKRADYLTLAKWWADVVKGTKVSLYIGQAVYKVTDGELGAGEIAKHLAEDAKISQISGEILFSFSDVKRNPKGSIAKLRSGAFALPALVPVNRARGGRAPAAPTGVSVKTSSKDVRIRWNGGSATTFAIWRVKGRGFRSGDTGDARNLVAVVRSTGKGVNEFVDKSKARGGTYAVTAYDRLWNQSGLGEVPAPKPVVPAKPSPVAPTPEMSGGTNTTGTIEGHVRQP